MSFLKENKVKVIIVTIFSVCMAVLFRIYSVLDVWTEAIRGGYGLTNLVKLILVNWQIYAIFAGILLITSVIVFNKKIRDFIYKYRFALAGGIFVLCVIFEISGSSIGQWCNYFNSEDSDIVLGTSRYIRSDEFCLTTPYFFSQSMSDSENAYEYFSDYANGYESDLFMGIRQPIKHILTVFRPFTLGYLFLSPAKGLSFWWCGKLIALFLATFEMGMFLTKKNKGLSFIMTSLITFSPLVQWWFSTGAADIIIFTEAAMLLFNKYLTERKLWKRLLLLVGILYMAGCFIMLLYPSWQVPFVYIILVFTAWIIISNRKKIALKWYDYASVAAGLAGLAAVFVYIFTKSADAIELISNTVYPGERLETGGGSFANMFTYPMDIWFSITNFGFGPNISESATVFDLFPFGFILPIVVMIKNKKKDWLSIMLLGLNLFFFIWIAVGFPKVLAQITFMSNSQSARTMLAFGFVNVILLVRGLSMAKESVKCKTSIGISVGITGVVMIIAALTTAGDYLNVTGKKLLILALGASCILLFVTLIAFMQYHKKNGSLTAILLTIIIAMTCGIMTNPVRKGVDSVYDIDWVEEILDVCEVNGKEDIWAIECSNLDALPYANVGLLCGVKTINATAVYPNMELWGILDTSGSYSDVYNRYAHIGICVKESGEPEFELLTADSFKVYITFEDLKKAGVTYITGMKDLSEYAENSDCDVTLVSENKGIYIYRIE